jgi:hypothetical protein
VAPERGCVKATAGNVAFLAKYRERKDFHDRWWLAGRQQFVLTNLRTGQRFAPMTHHLWAWSSVRNGEIWFELSQLLDVPAGSYSLALEYSRDDEIVSTGYKLILAISDTPGGRRPSVK